jgi:hypothetical protein
MTATVHLIRNPLAPFKRETFHVEHGTRIIDWLQDVAPDGFGMEVELYVNQQRVDVIDSDRQLQSGDVCAAVVAPGFVFFGVEVKLATILINAVVSLAIGLTLNLLFAPKNPRSNRGPNPVYDIGASRNSARLGEPIPVCYGEVVTVPDFAAPPYVYYSITGSDDQLVDQLFCIGVGKFEEITADDIIIGDTPASSFPPDVVSFRQFQLGSPSGNISDHQGRMGEITTFSWTTEAFGVGELFFEEDVYTAPEVTDWEFRDDITSSTTVVSTSVDLVNGGASVVPGRDQVFITFDADLRWRSGQAIDVTGGAPSQNGQYFILSIEPDTSSPLDADGAYTKQVATALGPVGSSPADGTVSVSFTIDVSSSRAQTPWYRAQPEGKAIKNRIALDFEAPGGLYRIKDTGARLYIEPPYAPKLRIEAEEIDPVTGSILNEVSPGSGFSLLYVYEQPARQVDPLRRTILLQDDDVNVVPAGQVPLGWRGRPYVVRVTAEHTFLDSSRYVQRILWVGLKGVLAYPDPNEAYGDVTLLAVRMRGTNGISAQAQNQLKVRARRIYPLFDGSDGVSANPVDVINDIYRDTFHGFGRPTDEIDADTLNLIRPLWQAQDVRFDGVFLQDITGWEALEEVLLPAVARPALEGGQLTIVADKKKPVTMFLFNDMSIVRDSFAASFTIDNTSETDGIEVEYRDSRRFDPAYARYPAESSNPQRLVYRGVTSADYAAKLARLFFNRRGLQRQTCSFKTEMQGMVPLVGDKISVASPVIKSGDSGRVVSITDERVVLDKRIVWGANAQIAFTQPDMSPTAWYDVTEGPEPNIAILSTPVVETLDMSLLRTPTSWHFRTETSRPRDMLITSIDHNGGAQFTINALRYPEDNEDGSNPLFEGGPEHLVLDWDGTPL